MSNWFKLKSRGRTAVAVTPLAITSGGKTRSGYGGYPLGATPGALITGSNASDWVIDDRGDLCLAGAFAAAKTLAASSYLLSVAGVVQPLSITAPAAQAVVAANNTTAGTSLADTASVSQLRTMLVTNTASAGGLARGSTILCRDGNFNPTGGNWLLFAGTWTGTGYMTIKSENPASGTDADGHPIRGGGFSITKAYLGSFNDTTSPLEFRNISFLDDVAVTPGEIIRTQAAGYGFRFIECDVRTGPNATARSTGASLAGAVSGTFERCHFENLGTAAILIGGGLTALDNVFYRMVADGMQVNGVGHSILRNWLYFFTPIPGVTHGDFCQVGTPATDLSGWGEFAYNGAARGPDLSNEESGQFMLGGDPASSAPKIISDMHIHHNMSALDSQAICSLSSIKDSTVEFNTYLSDPCSTYVGPTPNPQSKGLVAARIQTGISVATGWVNCNLTNNITNAIDSTYASGCTIQDNLLFAINNGTINQPANRAAYLAALTVAFPNMWQTASAAPVTMKALARAYTPANILQSSGGVMRPDGTCPGALFPAVSGDWGAWNDGSAFDPGNPTWVAAHPPAFTA